MVPPPDEMSLSNPPWKSFQRELSNDVQKNTIRFDYLSKLEGIVLGK